MPDSAKLRAYYEGLSDDALRDAAAIGQTQYEPEAWSVIANELRIRDLQQVAGDNSPSALHTSDSPPIALPLSAAAQLGFRRVKAAIIATLLLSAILGVLAINIAPTGLPQAVVRFVILLGLAAKVLEGRNWARNTFAGLLGISAVYALTASARMSVYGATLTLLFGFVAVVYGFIAIVLVTSPSILTFAKERSKG